MDADIYVLANDKQSSTTLAFLDTYLPDRKYAHTTYEAWNEKQGFILKQK